MSEVKITVGGAIEGEAGRKFVDAWHRAERGESFRERHLAFESWDALARVLTGGLAGFVGGLLVGAMLVTIRQFSLEMQRMYAHMQADPASLR